MSTVALQVSSGPNTGHRIWVRLEQILRVGTSEMADVVIESTPGAAGFLFSIGHTRAGCFVECLETESTMVVNGKPVERVRLHDGDVLVLGNTQFMATIEELEP